MVLVTDHMRSRSHRLPQRHLRVAAEDHRIALGAELATHTRDIDGHYRQGPEILAYGSPQLVEGPYGPYYGLDQSLINELFEKCLDDDGKELCTRRTRDLLISKNIAHAISHPFDGHDLSFVGMFGIISEFAFAEGVNGGFFEHSADVIKAYIRFNNAILDGATLPEALINSTTRQIIDHIQQHGRKLHLWSGSDAHSHDFDRVVVAMASEDRAPESLRPKDLFEAMLHQSSTNETTTTGSGWQPPRFINIGRPSTPLGLLADITAIIFRNIRRNALEASRYFLHPVIFTKILLATYSITRNELELRNATQSRRKQHLEDDFNPIELLSKLRPAQAKPKAIPLRSVA
jgi:hypothetical protein